MWEKGEYVYMQNEYMNIAFLFLSLGFSFCLSILCLVKKLKNKKYAYTIIHSCITHEHT